MHSTLKFLDHDWVDPYYVLSLADWGDAAENLECCSRLVGIFFQVLHFFKDVMKVVCGYWVLHVW